MTAFIEGFAEAKVPTQHGLGGRGHARHRQLTVLRKDSSKCKCFFAACIKSVNGLQAEEERKIKEKQEADLGSESVEWRD